MKTNAQVAAAFIAGEDANGSNLYSRAGILYSYATPIAIRQDADTIRVSCEHHSPTTTAHHSHLWTAAHNAGYRGEPHWRGDASRLRKKDTPADTVPFHQDDRAYSTHAGRSRPDARAVIWQRLTQEELRQERDRSRRELDALLSSARA